MLVSTLVSLFIERFHPVSATEANTFGWNGLLPTSGVRNPGIKHQCLHVAFSEPKYPHPILA